MINYLVNLYSQFRYLRNEGVHLEIDHISTTEMLVLLAITPLLRTKTKLDWIIIYMWVYTVIASHMPFFISPYPMPVVLTTESRQNELLALIVLFVLALRVPFNPVRLLKKLAKWAIILSVLAIPFQDRWISGLVLNKSMNGILLASLTLYSSTVGYFLWATFCVLISHSSSAVLALAVVIFGAFINKKNAKKIFLLCACIGGSIALIFPRALFSGNRFEGYRLFFNDFSFLNWLFGKSPASFFAISSYRQAKEAFHMEHGFLLWMHSDPLQFIFEYGLLGLIPLIISASWVFKHAKKRERLALSAMIAGGIFYYPMHWYIHLFVVFCVIKEVYERAIYSDYRVASSDRHV